MLLQRDAPRPRRRRPGRRLGEAPRGGVRRADHVVESVRAGGAVALQHGHDLGGSGQEPPRGRRVEAGVGLQQVDDRERRREGSGERGPQAAEREQPGARRQHGGPEDRCGHRPVLPSPVEPSPATPGRPPGPRRAGPRPIRPPPARATPPRPPIPRLPARVVSRRRSPVPRGERRRAHPGWRPSADSAGGGAGEGRRSGADRRIRGGPGRARPTAPGGAPGGAPRAGAVHGTRRGPGGARRGRGSASSGTAHGPGRGAGAPRRSGAGPGGRRGRATARGTPGAGTRTPGSPR